MKNKKIINDILKLHPELEKDKLSLKKTVKFLRGVEPKVIIDKKFKSDLWEKLMTLAALKSNSVEGLRRKPWFLHIFSWVFASLLAFFGLFYVFGDSLFYTWSTPKIGEYEAQISDIDPLQKIRIEVESSGEISEPSESAIVEVQRDEIPSTIIIREDWASQIDVSQNQRLEIGASKSEQVSPEPQAESTRKASTESSDIYDENSVESESSDSAADTIPMWWWADAMDASMMRFMPADISAESQSDFSADINSSSSIDIDYSEEQAEEELVEMLEDLTDEFVLGCELLGWEISAESTEERICNIGDIICTESDFEEWVCEVSQ